MCGQATEERCRCCDPAGRRAAYREQRLRENGFEGDVDEEWAALSVAERAKGAPEHPEAAFDPSVTVRAARAAVTREGDEHAMLAADSHESVRVALARNVRAAAAVLARLATDVSRRVRVAAAANRATPARVLASMAENLRDGDARISKALTANPRTPDEAFVALTSHIKPRPERRANTTVPGLQLLHASTPTTEPDPADMTTERTALIYQDRSRSVHATIYQPAWKPTGTQGDPVVVLHESRPDWNPSRPQKRWIAEGHRAADLARRGARPPRWDWT